MRRGVRLRGAVVVITGASSGIGRATAHRFAKEGAHVVLAARGSESLDAAADECRALGARALSVATDVADGAAVEELARRAAEEFGGIDVWVNNAAVMAYGAVDEVPADVQHRIIEVNLSGQMRGARAALPRLKRRGKGVIVNVASLYAKMTSPYVGSYATSKYGVLGFSEVLRQELKPSRGIHVCTVLPGSVDTPIFRHAANYTGRTAKPPPPVISPDRVVRAIVRHTKHPRREVTVGKIHHALSWVDAATPRLYSEAVAHAVRPLVLGRTRIQGHPGNVFDPMPESDSVRGGWRSPLKRAVVVTGMLAGGACAARLSYRLGGTTRRRAPVPSVAGERRARRGRWRRTAGGLVRGIR